MCSSSFDSKILTWLVRVFHQCSIHRPDLNIELPEKAYRQGDMWARKSSPLCCATKRLNRRGVRSSELRSENKRRFLQIHICLECNVQMKQMNRLERYQRSITGTSERRRERLQRICDLCVGVLFVQTDASINLKPIARSETAKFKTSIPYACSCKLLSDFSICNGLHS
jgi:hypothetical protein